MPGTGLIQNTSDFVKEIELNCPTAGQSILLKDFDERK
jgi:hypothetical protein